MVQLPSGRPAADVVVTVSPPGNSLRTDEQGRFRLTLQVAADASLELAVGGQVDTRRYAGAAAPRAVVADGTTDFGLVALRYVGPLFPSEVFFARGGENSWSSRALASGDLDQDGVPDLVVGSGQSTFSILLNQGDGTFTDAQQFDTKKYNGWRPPSAAIGDLNGDGLLDIVVVSGDAAVVYLNGGNQAFIGPAYYLVGVYPEEIVLGDLDGDGNLDLVVAKAQTNSVVVLRNRGDGTFETFVPYETGGAPSGVRIGDLDGDGAPDLIVSNRHRTDNNNKGSVVILRNRGDGTFAATQSFLADFELRFIAVGDLDGDGTLDAVTNGPSYQATLLRGRGDGTWANAEFFPVESTIWDGALADLDNDGKLDLVIQGNRIIGYKQCQYNPHCPVFRDTISELRNLGGGVFEPPRQSTANTTWAMLLTDVDQDGAVDLVATNNLVWVLKNRNGHLETSRETQLEPPGPDYMNIADFDGDGDADLVMILAQEETGFARILRNAGDGTFTTAETFATSPYSYDVIPADLNGDGRMDLLIRNRSPWTNGTVTVHLQQSDGHFGAPRAYPVGLFPTTIFVADLDGDGDLDCITGNDTPNDDRLSILLNNGDGSFAETRSAYTGGLAMALGDLDGDGRPDLVIKNVDQIRVVRNRGDGSFDPPSPPLTQFPLRDPVVLGDWDGDGDLDIAATRGVKTIVLVNNGDGTFSGENPASYEIHGQAMLAGDLNGDGAPDLVVLSDIITLLLNDGHGAFPTRQCFGSSFWLSSRAAGTVALGDLDGDSDLDIASIIPIATYQYLDDVEAALFILTNLSAE